MSTSSTDAMGLDDPAHRWMEKLIRVRPHPEWGVLRVVRWYPGNGQGGECLRVWSSLLNAPKVVAVADVEVAEDRS